jgi:hypothetical protein
MFILIIPIPPRIHRIILALLELIILLILMRNDSTIHSGLIVLRNRANHNSISARARLAIERLTIAQDRKLEIGCGRVLKVDVLIVVVGVGVFVAPAVNTPFESGPSLLYTCHHFRAGLTLLENLSALHATPLSKSARNPHNLVAPFNLT